MIPTQLYPEDVFTDRIFAWPQGFGLSMLGQTSWLLLLTQIWPIFNETAGGRSYWLLFGLNAAAGVSCLFPRR
jgi:hypothetical protein